MARLYSDGSGKIYENDIFGRHTSINGGSCAFMLVLLFGGLLFSLMSSFFLESLLMALFTFIFLMCFLAHRGEKKGAVYFVLSFLFLYWTCSSPEEIVSIYTEKRIYFAILISLMTINTAVLAYGRKAPSAVFTLLTAAAEILYALMISTDFFSASDPYASSYGFSALEDFGIRIGNSFPASDAIGRLVVILITILAMPLYAGIIRKRLNKGAAGLGMIAFIFAAVVAMYTVCLEGSPYYLAFAVSLLLISFVGLSSFFPKWLPFLPFAVLYIFNRSSELSAMCAFFPAFILGAGMAYTRESYSAYLKNPGSKSVKASSVRAHKREVKSNKKETQKLVRTASKAIACNAGRGHEEQKTQETTANTASFSGVDRFANLDPAQKNIIAFDSSKAFDESDYITSVSAIGKNLMLVDGGSTVIGPLTIERNISYLKLFEESDCDLSSLGAYRYVHNGEQIEVGSAAIPEYVKVAKGDAVSIYLDVEIEPKTICIGYLRPKVVNDEAVRKEYIYDNREFWNTIDNHNEKILSSCSGYSTGVRIPLTPRDVVSLSNGTCDFVSSYFSIPEGVENLIGPYTDTALSSEERIFYGVYYGRCQIFVNSQLVYKADDWSFLKSKKIGVKPGDIVTVFIQIDDTYRSKYNGVPDYMPFYFMGFDGNLPQ